MADFLSPNFIKGAQDPSNQNDYGSGEYYANERKKKKAQDDEEDAAAPPKASSYLTQNPNQPMTKASSYMGN